MEAFWYGARNWKVRFAPEETGKWTYRSRSSKADDAGLNGQSGSFDCAAYAGRNPLYLHGGLKVSDDRRYLAHADGTPFFWLGDTAWNGVLKSDPGSWDLYLRDRVAKGFNVVQYVTTQWRTASGNADGRPAFYGREKISIDPVFYQWMDERVDAMNDLGVVAVPVLIWAIAGATAMLNPGNMLPDDQIITLARYMVARYGAHHVVWFLAGDADYRGEKAERWKKIGRAVLAASRTGSPPCTREAECGLPTSSATNLGSASTDIRAGTTTAQNQCAGMRKGLRARAGKKNRATPR